jgi:outer membrane receptor protein involved in Fe transport
LGYGFDNNFLDVVLNGYYTVWMDKGQTRSLPGNGIANISGINARHMGIELEATYHPVSTFNLKGMLSVGEWTWMDDVHVVTYDEYQKPLDTFNAFIAGVHVGNSAQVTAALSANYTPFKNFRMSADFNWFGKNFADYDLNSRTQIQDKVDAWQLPDYYTIDLSMNYKFKLAGMNATLFANLYNLLDAEYIGDAKDGSKHDEFTSLVYYGFGRTWSAGLKINF